MNKAANVSLVHYLHSRISEEVNGLLILCSGTAIKASNILAKWANKVKCNCRILCPISNMKYNAKYLPTETQETDPEFRYPVCQFLSGCPTYRHYETISFGNNYRH